MRRRVRRVRRRTEGRKRKRRTEGRKRRRRTGGEECEGGRVLSSVSERRFRCDDELSVGCEAG